MMISQKGQERVIASEAKQSYIFYLIDFMRFVATLLAMTRLQTYYEIIKIVSI